MKPSIPFLATEIQQMPSFKQYEHECVEATIFNRRDLDDPSWTLVWENIKKAVEVYGSKQVSFHFPVNNANYVEDSFIYNRLQEALRRATDLGLQGVVVHSNQVRLIKDWKDICLNDNRKRVIEALLNIRDKIKGDTWIALENMPVADNYAIEIDPLFSYPNDFTELLGSSVGIVWDICHYTNTIATIDQVLTKQQNEIYYPNIQRVTIDDFSKLHQQIKHWHFSSFLGISNPELRTICKEGVLPTQGTLSNEVYVHCLNIINSMASAADHIVFEIQEEDYTNRKNAPMMLEWFFKYAINKNLLGEKIC